MALSTDPIPYLNSGTGFLIAAVAFWVGAKGRFRGRYLGFALAEGCFGLAAGISNLLFVLQVDAPSAAEPAGAYALIQAFESLLTLAAVAGLALLLRTHPDPRSRGFGFSWRWAWPFAACIGLMLVVELPLSYGRWLNLEPRAWFIEMLGTIGLDVLVAAQMGMLGALAMAYARISSSNAAAGREVVLFAVAMALYPVARFGSSWKIVSGAAPSGIEGPGWAYIQGAALTLYAVTIGLAVALWLHAGRNATTTAPRNMALFIVALFLFGVGLTYAAPSFLALSAVSRIAMFLVFTYAIVRHQYLGIDLRMRWTIGKSTIAAVFIAVFFIASEAAQQFFGDALGSQYVGIIAAGALVFVIAPLSRMADRLAARAVPDVDATRTSASDGRPAGSSDDLAYLAALRAAHGEGGWTRRQEMHLAELAEVLGIGHRRALELRSQVEMETLHGAGDTPSA